MTILYVANGYGENCNLVCGIDMAGHYCPAFNI